jgi:hypothetical protein
VGLLETSSSAPGRARIDQLRSLQRLLDTAFRVPGTNIRFGWDPIIGLIPWVGDVVAGLYACAVIVHAHRLRIPRVVQLRMLLNVVFDVVIGLVPIVGDAADVFWKASSRNFALLERYAAEPGRARPGDWLFVAFALAAVIAVAAIPLVVLYWLVHLAGRTVF